MIYLASPYSHPDQQVRQDRYEAAHRFTARHLRMGIPIFSPIVYGHEFAGRFQFDYTHLTWAFFNEHMIDCCSELWVLTLPGWEESLGIDSEISYAKRIDKKIHLR